MHPQYTRNGGGELSRCVLTLDLAESGTNGHADGKVDDVALHR
jgi:hypothetical protein